MMLSQSLFQECRSVHTNKCRHPVLWASSEETTEIAVSGNIQGQGQNPHHLHIHEAETRWLQS